MSTPSLAAVQAPLKGISLFLITVALGAAAFMQVLDSSIANVSIPYIAGDLGVSATTGSWVITMFAAGNAIALPLTGWISERYGSVRIISASIFLFTLLSWLCAGSMNFTMLVVCRFLQGFAAGPLIPLSQSTILSCYPPEKKTFALSVFFVILIVAPVCGPVIGGWLTQEYSWPWIFYINIPIGIFATITTWTILKSRETPTIKKKSDLIGFCLLFLGIGLLQVLLDKGEQYDWFSSPLICILGVISVLSLIFLIVWELTDKDPIIGLKLFKDSTFTTGTLLTALSYMLIFGSVVITPLWLQVYMGYTSLWAGLAVAPVGFLPLLLAMPLVKLMNRFRVEYFIFTFYLVLFAVFMASSYMTPQVDFKTIALLRFSLGLALVLFLTPLFAFSIRNMPSDKMASAAGLFHFFRIFAGGAGTSLMIYLWDRRATLHHLRIGEFLTPFSPSMRNSLATLGSQHLPTDALKEVVNDQLTVQAYVLATNDVFRFSAWIALALAPVILFSLRKKIKENTASKMIVD